ncbi:hypothetical protein [Limnoglobus roseus]|uniref:Putative ATPase n=1 Tax=Limnoglobus roseus TaxID=2598579 RepID=A0A5C1AIW3_9BACT|nr:hypothetical protein [Limnoglobus roseus]QEL17632.1 putative ATPase [Limnoglobus roseus]
MYWTLNPVRPDLLARRANRAARAARGDAAGDADVLARRWVLVDLDPRRPANISATAAEKRHAADLALRIRDDLHARGWPEPVVADSGNGYNLLYRVDLPADDGGLVKRVLAALAGRFDTADAHVDRTVHNPARICKVPGTWARKGDDTPDRPHRRSRLLHVPDALVAVDRTLLDAVAGPDAPPPPPATARPTGPRSAGPGGWDRRLNVAGWLTDAGVAFRVKAEPDAHGRTVYVLARCPFDPAHADPDACVMQTEDGRLSARCFHNSCAGRGWQAFKAAIGPPRRRHYEVQGLPPSADGPTRRGPAGPIPSAPPAGGPPHDDSAGDDGPPDDPPDDPDGGGPARLPAIIVNDRQLPDVTCDALAALAAVNDPPVIFQAGGVLTRVRAGDDDDPWRLEPLTDSALKGVMARTARWYEVRTGGQGVEHVDASPPMEVVKDVATLPHWAVPKLRAVVEAPVFLPDGTLALAPGYHPAGQLWYAPAGGLAIPPVPVHPTTADIAAARALILDDLLGDFPFADAAGRAHAVAVLVVAFARHLIAGPTPLHLVDAPTEGTGKTLLVKVLLWVVLGRDAPAIPEAENDAEWRKRITAALVEGRPCLVLDNLNQAVDSGSLASALTTETWSDRLLGVSKMVQVRNRAVWIGTGNNVALSRELVRRTLWCRLDAGVERPAERTGFRHPHLLAWVRENRGRLVAAVLTLVQGWLARGRPPGSQTMGMYESWAEVVGGVLDVAGVPGLLANRDTFRDAQQPADDWPAFLHAWWAAHQGKAVGVAALFDLAVRGKYLDGVLGDGSVQSQRCRLGRAVTKMVDRVQGEYRVRLGDPDNCRRQQYRLQCSDRAAAYQEVAETIVR